MKLKCLHCLNEDYDKFAPTKKGCICLVCFERSVHETPENQREIAEIAVKQHLSKQTGGSNRKFTRAYMGMKSKLAFLESLPDKSEAQKNFTLGFKEAISIFETESK
jgi:hypothetical protein